MQIQHQQHHTVQIQGLRLQIKKNQQKKNGHQRIQKQFPIDFGSYQQLFSFSVVQHRFNALLNVHAIVELLHEILQIGHILMDALESQIRSIQNFQMIFTDFIV